MQLENNTINNVPHPNYKRIVVMITVIFVMIIGAFLLYQYFITQKSEQVRDLALRQQYQQLLITKSKEFFDALPQRTQEVADRQRKESQEFFKTVPSDNDLADTGTKEFFSNQSEQAYQEWKALQQ